MKNVITYIPNFIIGTDKWFSTLQNELNWERRPDAPRSEFWTNTLGRKYTYGKGAGERTYFSQESHPLIDEGRAKIAAHIGNILEGCFLNMYGHSRDWLGWHADDDPGINHDLPIAVITLGQGRNIQYREIIGTKETEKGMRNEYGETETVMLENGSLFLMHAGMQQHYEHRIPKASFEARPRISMTYRGLVS